MNPSAYYPIVLDLSDRRCVVLGDTPLAEKKALGLRAAGATVVHVRRAFESGDLEGAYLAIDASDNPEAQRAARAEADRERVLLNVADVTHQCDWIAPALVRRGPLQIAISTSGESPFLARARRERVESMFGEEWGPLTSLMGRMRRRLRRAGASSDAQQRAYRRLLRSPVTALLRDGRDAAAAALALGIEHGAEATGAAPMGEVVLAGAGPGDPDLVTLGTRAVLSGADVVFHDALVGPGVLRLCGPRAKLVDVGKRSGRLSASQADINDAMIVAARAGDLVVRLKGGDPFLFGRGGEEVEALQRAGVPVRVIPGVSSAIAAPAAAGIPLTHRGMAASVAFVTGHRAGGDLTTLESLARTVDTLVVLMPAQLDAIAARLASALGPDRPAAIVSKATTANQRVVRGSLGTIAAAANAAGLEPPSTLVVGDVVDVLSYAGGSSPVEIRALEGAVASNG